MADHPVRLFTSDHAIVRIGTALLDRTLPKEDWTHEAHLATCLWLLRERPDIAIERDLPAIIASYNVAVGGENTESAGYHETLTQLYIRGVRAFDARLPAGTSLLDAVNALLASKNGDRAWPLVFYSRDRLFSLEARQRWVDPDLAPSP